MNGELDRMIDECLLRMRAGESVEECLAGYPEHAEQLRPMLELALTVRSVPRPEGSADAVTAGREQMLAAVDREFSPGPVSKSLFARYAERIVIMLTGRENPDMKVVTRFAIAAFALVLLVAGWGVTAASANAIPGDFFYPVKTAGESFRLALTTSEVARQELRARFRETRQSEVQAVMESGREVEVRFQGELLDINSASWLVGELTVLLDADTEIQGTPVVGAMVAVQAKTTADGAIVGRHLAVQDGNSVFPELHDRPTPTRTQDPSDRPTRTATPAPTRDHEPTRTPTHTRTPVPTRDHEPTRTPTHEPTRDHEPTRTPTHEPTRDHEPTRTPTHEPTQTATAAPTRDHEPTRTPTHEPTHEPTRTPTHEPTHEPTRDHEPTRKPTHEPTHEPTPTPMPTDHPPPD